MMRILASLKIAGRALRRNKMRSLLTMLGIIIGVGAVIASVSLTGGATKQVEDQVASLGENVLTVFSGGPGRVEPLPLWDLECGFAPGDRVMEIRAKEDDAALALLDAAGERLGFWDDQYRSAVGSGLPSPAILG